MVEPSYKVLNNYFLVTSRGFRHNFLEVALDHIEMVKQIDKHNPSKILLDHRNITYNVNQSDAFNLVKLYQKHENRFKDIKLACCVKTEYLELGDYWKRIAKEKGFSFNAFDCIWEAENWLSTEA